MSSFNTSFTITRDEASILVSITSGERFAWEATNTQIDTIEDGTRFIIGADVVNNGIDLDFTNSTDPGVTGGTIRSDYINTILGLVNDARSTAIGITTNEGPLDITLDVALGVSDGLTVEIGNDYCLDLADGGVTGKTCFNFLAFSDIINIDSSDIDSSSSSDDNNGGGVGHGYNFFETADTVDVISNGANDDGTGSRARTVTIEGLDASFNSQTETVTLVGNGTVTSSNSYIRINKAFVTSSGTYHETNERDISLRRNTGGLKYVTIKKKIGRSRTGIYTVPTGKTAFITDIHVSSNTQRRFALKLYKLEGADDVTVPVNSPEVIYQTAHVENSNSHICYIKVPEKSDIWTTGKHDFGSGIVSVVIKISLVDN